MHLAPSLSDYCTISSLHSLGFDVEAALLFGDAARPLLAGYEVADAALDVFELKC